MIFHKEAPSLIWSNLYRSVFLGNVIVVAVILSGCYVRFTPYDPPWYPRSMKYVMAIEGYQSKIGDLRYNLWLRNEAERYDTQHLALAGQYLFAAQCGLTIFDVSEPAEIAVVGSYAGECGVDDLVVADGRAYLLARDKGVTVLDITVPTQPKLITIYELSLDVEAPPPSITVRNDCIYLYTPAAKLPPPGTSAQRKTYTGWFVEEPIWQVFQVQESSEQFHLQPIKTVAGMGRPRAASANYLYAATDWVDQGDTFTSKLQTIQVMPDCTVTVVNSQVVPAKIRDLRIYDTLLFVSVGGRIWVWDVTNPALPTQIEAQYRDGGRMGDFSRIDVDSSKLVGQGYSLTYEKVGSAVNFYLLAKRKNGSGDCRVWNQPDTDCKLNMPERYRESASSHGGVLYGDFVFYPYNIATNVDEFVLVDLAIAVYKLPR